MVVKKGKKSNEKNKISTNMKETCMKRLLAIILCFTVVMNVPIKTVKAASIGKRAIHKKYAAKVRAYNKKFCSITDGFKSQLYFRFYDLNHDGVNECVIQGVMYSHNTKSIMGCGGTDVAVYTYYKGKIKKVAYSLTGGGTWGGIYFLKNKKADISIYGRAGADYITYNFKKLKKGKLVNVGSADKGIGDDGISPVYKINGTQTSMAGYEDYVKKMSGGFKEIKLYQVTEKNLKKYI